MDFILGVLVGGYVVGFVSEYRKTGDLAKAAVWPVTVFKS